MSFARNSGSAAKAPVAAALQHLEFVDLRHMRGEFRQALH
jgi:hypothetical protein